MSVDNLNEARGYVITNGTVLVHENAALENIIAQQKEAEEKLGAHLDRIQTSFNKMEEGTGHLNNVAAWLAEFSGILAQAGHHYSDVAAASEKAIDVSEALAGSMGALAALQTMTQAAFAVLQETRQQAEASTAVLDHALSQNMELLALIEAIPGS